MSKISLLAYAVLISVASLLIATVLYLAFLGWPVMKYNLVQKWTGTDPNMMIEVLKFNECLNPLPMEELNER